MPADRVYVGAAINGSEQFQFYQRDMERKGKDGKWEAVPYFVLNRSEATTMSESAAKMFVARLRSLHVNSAFIEDARNGRRIEVANETVQESGVDTRVPMKASLDDQNFFAVRPANTTEGPKWFVRCVVPGRPEPDVIYSDTILGALQRAQDLGFLQYGESAPAPEPQPAAPVRTAPTWRRRTGDLK